jgi:hypothetical protein
MNRFINVCLILAAMVAAGCGIQKATEDTRDLVGVSNQKQQGILDAIQAMLQKTGQLVSAAHLQILDTAMKNMLSANSTTFLSPPMLMLIDATAYANEASVNELIMTEYVLFNTALLPSMGFSQDPAQPKLSAAAYSAFLALAALTPADKATTILNSLNDPKQGYPDTVIAYTVGRYCFTRDALFNPITNPKVTKTIDEGVLNRAVEPFQAMREIVLLANASQLNYSISIPKYIPNVTFTIDSVAALNLLGAKLLDTVKQKAPDLYNQTPNLLAQFSIPN